MTLTVYWYNSIYRYFEMHSGGGDSLDFEIGHFRKFRTLVTFTLTLDPGQGHTAVHHSSTKLCTKFLKDRMTFTKFVSKRFTFKGHVTALLGRLGLDRVGRVRYGDP